MKFCTMPAKGTPDASMKLIEAPVATNHLVHVECEGEKPKFPSSWVPQQYTRHDGGRPLGSLSLLGRPERHV